MSSKWHLTSRLPLSYKLLKAKDSRLESEMQNLSTCMRITSSHAGVPQLMEYSLALVLAIE